MNLIRKLLSKKTPEPVHFPEVNKVYKKIEGMPDEQVASLPCFRGPDLTVSCWRFPLRDRVRLLFTGRLWLMMMLGEHPPVCLMTEKPPFPSAAPKANGRGFGFWALGALIILNLIAFNYILRRS